MESIINGLVQTGSDKSSIILAENLPKGPEQYKSLWIRVTQEAFVDIRKVKEYNPKDKKIVLNKELRFAPNTLLCKYDVGDYNIPSSKITKLKVAKDSTKGRIKLDPSQKKMDKIYDKYWVQVKDDVRQVKEYIDNSLILDYDLSGDIAEGDDIVLLSNFFNDYVMFGIIDFTDFLGMDFSSLIDGLGGLFNFQMTSSSVSVCCLLVISVLFVIMMKSKKKKPDTANSGLFIPGIGRLGPQQPLIIQMPMQTKPFELPSSPFPKIP